MTGLTGNRVITENYEYMTCQNDQEIFRDQILIFLFKKLRIYCSQAKNERISSMHETM